MYIQIKYLVRYRVSFLTPISLKKIERRDRKPYPSLTGEDSLVMYTKCSIER